MATGTVNIDFGLTPSTEATVTVTGQSAILSTSFVEAFIMAGSTATNDSNGHLFAGVSFRLVCGDIVETTGFTIYVTCISGMATGEFQIKWVWS